MNAGILFMVLLISLIMVVFLYGLIAGASAGKTEEEIAAELDEQERYLTRYRKNKKNSSF